MDLEFECDEILSFMENVTFQTDRYATIRLRNVCLFSLFAEFKPDELMYPIDIKDIISVLNDWGYTVTQDDQ